jgi:hypothetical protein
VGQPPAEQPVGLADLDGARPVAGLPAVERLNARVVDRAEIGLDRHHGVRT